MQTPEGSTLTANVSPVVTILLALIAVILPLATIIIGYLQWKATKASNDAKDLLVAQHGTIEAMAQNVDGNLTEVRNNLIAVKAIADAFAAEVVRLQAKGTTTPYGEPTAETPVTLSAGVPMAQGSSAAPKNGV